MNEVIQAILNLLKNTLGRQYKKYYYGEIRVPNSTLMPFVEVIPVGTSVTNRGTWGMMNNEYSIRINVKSTLKKYLQSNTNTETLAHVQDLVEMIEGRDDDGNLKSTTILGVLHDNLQLSNTANINGDWDVTYDEIDLGDSYIVFAGVTFTVKVITI